MNIQELEKERFELLKKAKAIKNSIEKERNKDLFEKLDFFITHLKGAEFIKIVHGASITFQKIEIDSFSIEGRNIAYFIKEEVCFTGNEDKEDEGEEIYHGRNIYSKSYRGKSKEQKRYIQSSNNCSTITRELFDNSCVVYQRIKREIKEHIRLMEATGIHQLSLQSCLY